VGTSLTGEEHQSDWCAMWASGDFEVDNTRRDCKVCVQANQGAVAGHLSNGATTRFPKVTFGGAYLSIM
jgi:hypothetical protein